MQEEVRSGKLSLSRALQSIGHGTTPTPPPRINGKAPQGVTLAHEAINCLNRIREDDPLRKRGFKIVFDHIKANAPENFELN